MIAYTVRIRYAGEVDVRLRGDEIVSLNLLAVRAVVHPVGLAGPHAFDGLGLIRAQDVTFARPTGTLPINALCIALPKARATEGALAKALAGVHVVKAGVERIAAPRSRSSWHRVRAALQGCTHFARPKRRGGPNRRGAGGVIAGLAQRHGSPPQ